MTMYCLSSASRSRPSAFVVMCFGGGERTPQDPVPPNVMVDTPDDEPLEPDDDDPDAPLRGPSHKRVPDEKHGLP